MRMLQIRNLPDELHSALAERAREQSVSMSEYVVRLLRRDLARPTIDEWVAEQRADRTPSRHIDVVQTLDEVRMDYDPDERTQSEAPENRSTRP